MEVKKKFKSIDVIILSWDREIETLAAIKSAESQVGVDVKIIVVDQGSNPECKSTLKKYCSGKEHIVWHGNEKNTGVPGGRNQASFIGSSDIIVSLDNDAEFEHNNILKDTLDVFNQDEDLAVACFRVSLYGMSDIDQSSWSYGMNSSEWGFRDFYTTRFVGAGHAIRRDLFEVLGGYDDHLFFLHEEVEISRRFINLGYKIRYFSHLAVGHKVSSERRVSWGGKRWFYHVRNKTYLNLKYRTSIFASLFHSILLLRDSVKMKQFWVSLSATYQGVKMFMVNKESFTKEHCKFNEESEKYYRKYTPGAQGTMFHRIKRQLRGK